MTSASSTAISHPESNEIGVKIGVGVRLGAVCLILVAFITWVVLRNKKRARDYQDADVGYPVATEVIHSNVLPKSELDAETREEYEASSENRHRPYDGNVMCREVHS